MEIRKWACWGIWEKIENRDSKQTHVANQLWLIVSLEGYTLEKFLRPQQAEQETVPQTICELCRGDGEAGGEEQGMSFVFTIPAWGRFPISEPRDLRTLGPGTVPGHPGKGTFLGQGKPRRLVFTMLIWRSLWDTRWNADHLSLQLKGDKNWERRSERKQVKRRPRENTQSQKGRGPRAEASGTLRFKGRSEKPTKETKRRRRTGIGQHHGSKTQIHGWALGWSTGWKAAGGPLRSKKYSLKAPTGSWWREARHGVLRVCQQLVQTTPTGSLMRRWEIRQCNGKIDHEPGEPQRKMPNGPGLDLPRYQKGRWPQSSYWPSQESTRNTLSSFEI